MSRIFSLLIAILWLAASAHAQSGADPFRVEMSATRLPPSTSGVLELRVVVPNGHHIYRDMVRVQVLDEDGLTMGKPDLPPGLSRPDPASPGQSRELYPFDLIVEIPVVTPSVDGAHDPLLEVTYQGCREGLCFPPVTHQVSPLVLVGQATGRRSLEYGSAWVDVNGGTQSTRVHPPRAARDFSGVPESAVDADIGDDGVPHPVVARLITDKASATPGGTLRLGVHLEQADGWHTYWKSPGGPGQPPEITWALPEGTLSTDFEYAVPMRFDVSEIVSYGYDDENLLYTDIELPEALEGSEVELGAEVYWLVCEATCIPGSAELSLTLPLVAEDPGPGPLSGLFDAYEAAHPTPIEEVQGLTLTAGLAPVLRPDDLYQASFLIRSSGEELKLALEADTWPAFTPIATGKLQAWEAEVIPLESGYLVTMEGYVLSDYLPGDGSRIGGLLNLELGGRPVVTELYARLGGEDSAGLEGVGGGGGGALSEQSGFDIDALDYTESIPWVPFNDVNLRQALCSGAPVFVDFTAEWCLSCKVNEGTVLETDRVRGVMSENGVIPMKADWTNRDPMVSRWLKHFERGGVPFYVVIPPGGGLSAEELERIGPEDAEVVLSDGAIILGEFITPDSVVSAIVDGTGGEEAERTFGGMLFFAFIGGLVLNIFPCVLPVLALKLYSLIEQQDSGDSHRRMAGIAYTLGVVLSFMAVAVAVMLMKQVLGVEVAWGFMFQEPIYIIVLAAVVFIFGLSLIGLFDVPAIGANQAAEASNQGGGVQSHFLTGVFATLIATPCSAPFLGPAMGFALTLDRMSILLFFAVAGFGLALPFLVVAFVPALIRFLPKPGAWMESFKKLVGWSMMAVVIWLVLWVFGAMSTSKGITAVVCFLGSVGLASHVFGKYGSVVESSKRQLGAFCGAVAIGAMGGWLSLSQSGWMEMPEIAEVVSVGDPLVCATD